MRAPATLAASALLDCWEQVRGQPPLARALALAGLWDPTTDWPSRPIGARDRALWDLYSTLFGSALEAVVSCPACGTRSELSLTTLELRLPDPEQTEREVRIDGLTVRARTPTSADLLAAFAAGGAELELLRRCVVSVSAGTDTLDLAAISPELHGSLEAQIAELDPQADARLRVRCTECEEAHSFALDPGDFLFAALDRWCRGLLRDVHVLAGAYGWTEVEILNLSPMRRRIYLEMVEGNA